MILKNLTAAAMAGLLCVSFAAPVVAQDMLMGADAIAKRQQLMKSNGGTLRGAGSATGDAAVVAAQTIFDNVAALGDLWPEDSMEGDTKALPAVWSDSEGFLVAYNESVAASVALLAAAKAGDAGAYGAALKVMGGTCGSCHGTYKAK